MKDLAVLYNVVCICKLQYLSAWNNYKFAIDCIAKDPRYRMKAQEIAKSEGLLDNKKKKNKTKTKVCNVCFSTALLAFLVALLVAFNSRTCCCQVS